MPHADGWLAVFSALDPQVKISCLTLGNAKLIHYYKSRRTCGLLEVIHPDPTSGVTRI